MKLNCKELMWILLYKIGPIEINESDVRQYLKIRSLAKISKDYSKQFRRYLLSADTMDGIPNEEVSPEYTKKTLEEWGNDRGKAEQHGDGT